MAKKRNKKLWARCVAAARDVNARWLAVFKKNTPPERYEEPSPADLRLATISGAEMIYRRLSP
jgi:hypothetical protein